MCGYAALWKRVWPCIIAQSGVVDIWILLTLDIGSLREL